MEYLCRSEAETEALGARLAAVLSPGDVVAYRGGLGMGKTAFTRGLARGLGYSGRVTSPTFTIVNEYEGGRLPLFHFDMYRLEDADSLFDIGCHENPSTGDLGQSGFRRTVGGWTHFGQRLSGYRPDPQPHIDAHCGASVPQHRIDHG